MPDKTCAINSIRALRELADNRRTRANLLIEEMHDLLKKANKLRAEADVLSVEADEFVRAAAVLNASGAC